MATATKTFRSYSAAPSQDFCEDRRIQVSAWPHEGEDDPHGIIGGESEKFHCMLTDDATRFLTERGCDPMMARMMVEVASHGCNRVAIFPAEGRVDVGGERR